MLLKPNWRKFMPKANLHLNQDWVDFLHEEFNKPYFHELMMFVEQERSTKNIFPPSNEVFEAFNQTPLENVKVVIVGQDPYHGIGQANGLCFSVREGVKLPPSLKNIFKEMIEDVGIEMPSSGSLAPLAKQGVLLLNATLTVREKEPQSHYGMGWERFTNEAIAKLMHLKSHLVFMLWGKAAQEKCVRFLDDEGAKKHLFLKAAHPSPYSAYNGFFGCRHFSKANQFLVENGQSPILWQL
jgi:uracil-DNA glycosylase